MPEQQSNPRRRLRREPDTPGVIHLNPTSLDQLGWMYRDVNEKYIPRPGRELSDKDKSILRNRFLRKELLDGRPARPDLPPPPTRFQRDPLIQGRPSFVREATRLINTDPYVKSNVDKVLIGPSASVIKDLINSKTDPLDYEFSDIGGQYDPSKKELSISPRLNLTPLQQDVNSRGFTPGNYINDKLGILSHELTHATGFRHGDKYMPEPGNILPDPAENARLIFLWNNPGFSPAGYPISPTRYKGTP